MRVFCCGLCLYWDQIVPIKCGTDDIINKKNYAMFTFTFSLKNLIYFLLIRLFLEQLLCYGVTRFLANDFAGKPHEIFILIGSFNRNEYMTSQVTQIGYNIFFGNNYNFDNSSTSFSIKMLIIIIQVCKHPFYTRFI